MASGRLGRGAVRAACASVGLALLMGYGAGCSDGETTSTKAVQSRSAPPSALGRGGRGWSELRGRGFTSNLANGAVVADQNGLHIGGKNDSARAASIHLASMGRDGGRAVTGGAMRAQGRSLFIDRALAEERLDMIATGLEQSWKFAQRPPGNGDLVVRLETAGMTRASVKDGGLRFDAGNREIVYGAATWVDATGHETPVSTSYRAGQIVLTVPTEIVEGAVYPALLDPVISSRMILATPARLPGGQAKSTSVDCNATRCLVAWIQDGQTVARRLQLDGTPLDDDDVIVLGEVHPALQDARGLTVAATPTDFLVSWVNSYVAEDAFQWVSVSAATGAVSDVPPQLVAVAEGSFSAPLVSTYGNGEQLLVYRQGLPHRYIALRLLNGVLQAPATGVDMGEPVSNEPPALVAGLNQFAVVDAGRLRRIAAGTGALLDPAGIQYSKFGYTASAGTPAVAFDGANYIVVWFDSGKLQATRVRASDGVVLDPDDDFNELPGSRVLCTGSGSYPTVAVEGGNLYVTWQSAESSFAGAFPLAPWTPSAAACSTSKIADQDSFTQGIRKQAGAEGVAALVDNSQLRSLGFAVTAGSAVSTSNNAVLNYFQIASEARVASNGRDFMVSGIGTAADNDYHAFLQPIDGATGELMAEPTDFGIAGFQALPLVASSNSYLINLGTYVRRLSCDGKVGPLKALLPNQSLYALVSDGAQYFALTNPTIGGVNAYRIDLDGNPIDASSKELLAQHLGFLAAGCNDEPAPNLRTFTALARTQTGFAVLRMRSATGNALAPILVDSPSDAMPNMVASDGTNMILGWARAVPSSDPDSWTALLDPTTGLISDQKKWPAPGVGGLSFDGTSYLQLLPDQDYTTSARRFDTALAQIDAGSGFDVPVFPGVHASNRHGRTLLVESEYNAHDLGSRLVGYFIDNELAPGDPDDAPITCVLSNEGGAGGEGGLGGAPGQAGGTANAGSSTGGSEVGGANDGGADSGGAPGGGSGGDASAGAPQGGVASGGEPNEPGGGEPGETGGSQAGGSAGNAGSAPEGGAGVGGSSSGGSAGSSSGGVSASEPGAGGSTAGSDGEAGGASSGESGGCGCRTTRSTPHASWVLLVGAVALLRRRRRDAND